MSNYCNLAMSHSRIFEISITLILIVLPLIRCLEYGPDCSVALDPAFGGSLVNCTNRKLTNLDSINFPLLRVTTLDVSYNNITYLPNSSALHRFKDLKRLMCTRCNLNGMGNSFLKGLGKLEVLFLDHNNLNIRDKDPAIPPGVFRHVPLLKELYIDNNGHYHLDMLKYLKYLDIFEYLPDLTYLSIDSFETLTIGKEFLKFSKLYSLSVHCKFMTSILDTSLEGFQNSTVKIFELTDGNIQNVYYKIGLNVFQYLPNVSYLGLRYIRVGNQNALAMMKPLVGKRIDTILFQSVYSPTFGYFEDMVRDTTVTVNDSVYLRNVNVTNFLWYDSGVHCLEYNIVLSKTWQHNIKRVLLETNALTQTSILLLFRLMLLQKLEVFTYLWTASGMAGRIHEFGPTARNVMPNVSVSTKKRTDLSTNMIKDKNITTRQVRQAEMLRDERNNSLYYGIVDTPLSRIQSLNTNDQNSLNWVQKLFHENDGVLVSKNVGEFQEQHFTVRSPPKLRTVIIDGSKYFKLNHQYTLLGSQIDSVAFTNAIDDLQFHGTVYGLENLTSFSLEGSQRVDIGLRFLDAVPSLRNLNLRKTCVTPEFYETNGRRITEKLTALENIDLSDNGLKTLPTDMFLTNKQLRNVRLLNNRLAKIPFNLKLTPTLEVLNLRGNSFIDLSAEERAAIDDHILSIKNFTILLGDNEFSCTCSNLAFIAWLKSRQNHFDLNGNYTCISEDGTMSFTGSHMDIKAFWRRCHGSYFLMLSATLACSLVALYLGIFLVMKKKTEIISKVLQLVVPGFRLKTRWDYHFDVCIGYADEDGVYVKDVLLRLLENKWDLSTFVHQRDLRQDPLEMSNALRDSWRNLLIVTEAFLYRYNMAHNVMKVASFFVSPSNPRSVVVIVEESVRHRIPDYVLQVVDEDNIIILPRLEPLLDYQTKEFLRTRLIS